MDPQPQPGAGNEPPFKELPVANLAPQHPKSKLPKLFLWLLVLVVVGLAIFLLTDHHKAAAPPAKKAATTGTGATLHITNATKRYDSTSLSLGFYYPTDWSVNDPGQGKLTVTSPPLSLKTAGNQSVQARIVMTIQNQQTSISQFAANQAIAPLASQKLTYKQPTPDQRAQTYLTPVNYAGANGTIDAFYITGDNGYSAGQYVPQADIIEDDPLISLSFYKCTGTACSNYGSATSIVASAWANTALSQPLITMLESLQID